MQVGGALLDREPQQVVERPHHGRAAREIAQVVEIVVAAGAGGASDAAADEWSVGGQLERCCQRECDDEDSAGGVGCDLVPQLRVARGV